MWLNYEGALASLAALDIAKEFEEILRRDQIMCYTFGAPRTGNHTFAKECNVAVPETWNIMNARYPSFCPSVFVPFVVYLRREDFTYYGFNLRCRCNHVQQAYTS